MTGDLSPLLPGSQVPSHSTPPLSTASAPSPVPWGGGPASARRCSRAGGPAPTTPGPTRAQKETPRGAAHPTPPSWPRALAGRRCRGGRQGARWSGVLRPRPAGWAPPSSLQGWLDVGRTVAPGGSDRSPAALPQGPGSLEEGGGAGRVSPRTVAGVQAPGRGRQITVTPDFSVKKPIPGQGRGDRTHCFPGRCAVGTFTQDVL